MSALPNEILSQIFKHLQNDDYEQQKDLSQCALTCRSWRLPAQMLCFETVCVPNLHNLREAKKFLREDRNGFSLGDVVKKLRFKHRNQYYYSLYWGYKQDILILIDEVFPFLEVLDYDQDHLISPESIFSIICSGKFLYLKNIPALEYGSSYFRLNHLRPKFKDIVQTLQERNKQ